MNEDAYYQADRTSQNLVWQRLGRRFQFLRKVGDKHYQPHKFWSVYMDKVANPNYRGEWKGLAPMRLAFKNGKQSQTPGFDAAFSASLKPQITDIRAYPNCYLFPIGWTAGVVIQAEGQFAFASIPSLVSKLRAGTVFRLGAASRTLEQVLGNYSDSIRSALIDQKRPQAPDQSGGPYLALGLIDFEGQNDFQKPGHVDRDLALRMLTGGAVPEDQKLLITPGIQSLVMTVLNRGTLVIPGDPKDTPMNPACSLSNLKNALLITMLMQKFHHNSFRHKSAAVAAMRVDVMNTFQQLENFWQKPAFRAVCDAHAGIRKMRESAEQVNTGDGTTYG